MHISSARVIIMVSQIYNYNDRKMMEKYSIQAYSLNSTCYSVKCPRILLIPFWLQMIKMMY